MSAPSDAGLNCWIASSAIRIDEFRFAAEQRKRIAQRIKELQPAASNRQIAKTLGVHHVCRALRLALEDDPSASDDALTARSRQSKGG